MANSDVTVRLTADASLLHKEVDAAIAKVKAYREQLGIVAGLFNFFQGRCTFFACLFSSVGIVLAFSGKLTAEYVALVGAIQALLLAHSYKEDHYAQATMGQQADNNPAPAPPVAPTA